jgi:hypothetical protein
MNGELNLTETQQLDIANSREAEELRAWLAELGIEKARREKLMRDLAADAIVVAATQSGSQTNT